MAITRRALLISNPGEQRADNYARGVYVDVRNYQNFLNSSPGGAWESSEVEWLDRPTKAAVQLKVAELARYDYTFIMFSGHGWYSSVDRDRVLHLREKQDIGSQELLEHAAKRTLILDCCLEVHQETIMEKKATAHEIQAAERQIRKSNREACRSLFSQTVERAPLGCVRISSCAIDERSWDDGETGGRYNSSLLGCTEKWINNEEAKVWGTDAVFSIAEAHEAAAALTRLRSRNSQNPSIEKAKSGPYFPFAVFA